MKNGKSTVLFSVVVTTMGFLFSSCQSPERPSNLALSEADSQAIQSDRIQQTNHAHQVVANVRQAIAPVEAILKDLSNVTGRIDARVGGKSLDDLHLSDGFRLINQMLNKSYHGGIVRTKRDGSWSIRQKFSVDPSFQLGRCSDAEVELAGNRNGDSDELALNLIECGSSDKLLLADIQVNRDTIRAGLHLENLKDLSISTRTGSACSLQISLAGGQLASTMDCEPIEIQLGANRVEISPLTVYLDSKGVSGKITVRGYDQDQNEFLTISYPKGSNANSSQNSSTAPISGSGDEGNASPEPAPLK